MTCRQPGRRRGQAARAATAALDYYEVHEMEALARRRRCRRSPGRRRDEREQREDARTPSSIAALLHRHPTREALALRWTDVHLDARTLGSAARSRPASRRTEGAAFFRVVQLASRRWRPSRDSACAASSSEADDNVSATSGAASRWVRAATPLLQRACAAADLRPSSPWAAPRAGSIVARTATRCFVRDMLGHAKLHNHGPLRDGEVRPRGVCASGCGVSSSAQSAPAESPLPRISRLRHRHRDVFG